MEKAQSAQFLQISQTINSFRDLVTPEKGLLVGYGALIKKFDLKIPLPAKLSIISTKTRRYGTDKWEVFTPRHEPKDNLFGHLTFAIRYEGIDLSFFKSLFKKIDNNNNQEVLTNFIKNEPNSQYSRKIWFLYEWLMDKKLDILDLENRSYVDLLDEKQQYPGKSINSSRHRVRNNLPGTKDFCPLIRRTHKLETFISKNLDIQNQFTLGTLHKDILTRVSAFLLLKDSKSSFTIEGEHPPNERLRRWGKAIGQAGRKSLTKNELVRLQKIIIQDDRFTKLGWRKEGGFVGTHDRDMAPVPDHISARWEDVNTLISGLIKTSSYLKDSKLDPVLAAAIISFGFIFIHPMADGNGRLHRYLIHHILVEMNFANGGFVFPISAAILNRIDSYREVLESFSLPLLDLIKWQHTAKNNIEVLNQTIDYYRYFDATKQAEFLYECVEQTIDKIVPNEIEYLKKYDEFKEKVSSHFDILEKTLALLVKFLGQNNGKLSVRAKDKEFVKLSDKEVLEIERIYGKVFL